MAGAIDVAGNTPNGVAEYNGEHAVSPEARAAHAIILANEPIFTGPGYSFWDTLATALVFRPELATWDRAPVMITASQDAGCQIIRWNTPNAAHSVG